jgi:hypothetical protein
LLRILLTVDDFIILELATEINNNLFFDYLYEKTNIVNMIDSTWVKNNIQDPDYQKQLMKKININNF